MKGTLYAYRQTLFHILDKTMYVGLYVLFLTYY